MWRMREDERRQLHAARRTTLTRSDKHLADGWPTRRAACPCPCSTPEPRGRCVILRVVTPADGP